MSKRPPFLLLFSLVVVPIGALAAPVLMPQPESIGRAPSLSLHEQLSPADRVASCLRQLERTNAEIGEKGQELQRLRERLSKTEQERHELIPAMANSAFELKELEQEIPVLENELSAAIESAKLIESDAPRLAEQEKGKATRDYQQEVETAGETIDEARRQRDEERKRIGALPSVQDEIVRARQLKREATAQADLRLTSLISAADDRCRRAIADAQAVVQRTTDAKDAKVQSLRETQRTLAVGQAKLDRLPDEIAELKGDISSASYQLASLKDARELEEQSLAVAKAEVQRIREQEAERTVEQAPPALQDHVAMLSVPTPSITPKLSIPAFPKTVKSDRYYDPTYRPSVGHHYVEGHMRNGRYVRGHYRTNPDGSFWNNFSSAGNTNPNTGKMGTRYPDFRRPQF